MGCETPCKYERTTGNKPFLWQHWTALKAAILHSCQEPDGRNTEKKKIGFIPQIYSANRNCKSENMCMKKGGEQDNQTLPDISQAEGQF